MKAYLCSEEKKEVVEPNLPEGIESRQAIMFIIKAKNWKQAEENAGLYGAKVVRVLTKEEQASEGEDGSYDIKD